ncbi:hypothetical protein C8J56DRAFT_1026874 [Mycena floridula]|nr:hypothetical protein C8J56DRAFT_1026874 [Mycena floridula]
MTSVPSQSSAELSDLKTPSAIGPCIEDDKEFIRNARERTMVDLGRRRMIKGGKRGRIVVEGLTLPSQESPTASSDDGEDVWQWNEGDEALMEWDKCWSYSLPPWTSAAAALERRLARTPPQTPQRREVQSAALEMRTAMILWLTLTSTSYKSADEERGLRDCEEWDMQRLIDVWYMSLPYRAPGPLDFLSSSYQRIDGFKEANEFLNSLPQDTNEYCYLSWVNKYPSDLRDTAMEDCIKTAPRGGSLNICSWWAAMCWKMVPEELSYPTRVKRSIYCDVWSASFLPLSTPSPGFRDAIQASGHTCWEAWDMDNYAAAMAFPEEDPKVVGIDVREDSKCRLCRLERCLRSLGETLPVKKRAFSADLTELLVMLPALMIAQRTECSRRKVSWSEISTSAQKEFINTGFSDFSEEAESSDAGSDVDEASGENKRAPVAVIHPSQVNTAGHEENNPSSGLVQNEEVVDVDEESADAARRPNFTNLLSENSHPYSINVYYVKGPVNFGEAVIHGRQIQDSQQINALSTNSGGSHGGSDHSFEYIPDVPLHPPAVVPPQHIQNGTPVLWLQDHPKSGSADLIVGWQQGYIRDGVSASNFVERASVGQNGGLGDYATTEASKATYANGNPIRRQAPVQHNSNGSQQGNYSITPMANPITDGIPGQDSGAQYPALHDTQLPSYANSTRSGNVNYNADGQAWVPYDQPAAVSVQQEIISDKADLSKDDMIKEIKKFLTESFERLGVELHGTKRNKKLPWLQFDDTLEDEGIEMVNWPKDVLTPGRGSNSSKGLAGVPVRDLKKIYKAIHSDTAKLELRHIPGARKPGQAVSQQEFFAESSASGSRKRPRDAETDGNSRPKKQLVFKNIRFDGVMEAWKA